LRGRHKHDGPENDRERNDHQKTNKTLLNHNPASKPR
jgi:hypothetical protein